MTFRSWRSTRLNCLTRADYLTCPDGHFRPAQTPNALQRGPAGKLTQWAFHEVQEHPNRNSDEKVMTFRSWGHTLLNCLTRAAYLTCPDGPFRPAQTPNVLQRGPDGKLTQWAFHEVQEHPNRNSDEKFMTFRSWGHTLLNCLTRAAYLTCPDGPFRPAQTPNVLQKGSGWKVDSMGFP